MGLKEKVKRGELRLSEALNIVINYGDAHVKGWVRRRWEADLKRRGK